MVISHSWAAKAVICPAMVKTLFLCLAGTTSRTPALDIDMLVSYPVSYKTNGRTEIIAIIGIEESEFESSSLLSSVILLNTVWFKEELLVSVVDRKESFGVL